MPEHDLVGIVDDLDRGYDGDAWHGPPLRKVLDGVTADVASARPIHAATASGRIVVHLPSSDDVITSRIDERRRHRGTGRRQFSAGDRVGADAWSDALRELDYQHARLVETVSNLDAERLDETVAGKDYSLAHMPPRRDAAPGLPCRSDRSHQEVGCCRGSERVGIMTGDELRQHVVRLFRSQAGRFQLDAGTLKAVRANTLRIRCVERAAGAIPAASTWCNVSRYSIKTYVPC